MTHYDWSLCTESGPHESKTFNLHHYSKCDARRFHYRIKLSVENQELIGMRPTKTPNSLCVIMSMLARATQNDPMFCETLGTWYGGYVVAESSGSELDDEGLLLIPYRSRKR